MGEQIGEMNGHTARALHLAVSPDGARVCSASADETLQIWKCFGEPPKVKVSIPFFLPSRFPCQTHRTASMVPVSSRIVCLCL